MQLSRGYRLKAQLHVEHIQRGILGMIDIKRYTEQSRRAHPPTGASGDLRRRRVPSEARDRFDFDCDFSQRARTEAPQQVIYQHLYSTPISRFRTFCLDSAVANITILTDLLRFVTLLT